MIFYRQSSRPHTQTIKSLLNALITLFQDIGETSMNEFICNQKRTLNQLLEQKREPVKERLDSQLLEMKRPVQSSEKVNCEKKLLEPTNDAKEMLNVSIK